MTCLHKSNIINVLNNFRRGVYFMKNFDTNELNTEKIVKLLNSRIIVNENGYDAIKNRQIYRYIKYEESNQILILINLKNIKKRRLNLLIF